MKSWFPSVAVVSMFVAVVCLSATRVDPIHAEDCPEQNSFTLSNSDVETNSEGEFTYQLYVEAWELVEEPFSLTVTVNPSGHYNVDYENVEIDPLYYQLPLECEYTDTEPWDIAPTIMGSLVDKCESGTLNIRLKWLTTPSLDPIYSAWPTTIPAAESEECEE